MIILPAARGKALRVLRYCEEGFEDLQTGKRRLLQGVSGEKR